MNNNQKATKRALLTSVMALVMCVVMLVGTTFAWFTDTASTGVNKIQAGNLDIELMNEAGTTPLDSATALKWKTEDTGEVLWEPNCKYELEGFQIKNAGNLAVKYKVVLKATDITKTADGKSLLDVIDWTIKLGSENVTVTKEQVKNGLVNGVEILVDKVLAPKELSGIISVTGHMDANAGNDYQGLKIGGFGITVLATQASYEKDSIDETYDKDAEYPTLTTGKTLNEVFGDSFDFGSTNPSANVVLDGQGLVTVSDYVDGWFAGDVTIKGVTFLNGVCFTAKNDNTAGTITFEDCTFYACDQSKIDLTSYQYNSLKNSGDGLCLNVDTKNSPSLKVVVKDCAFIGENDTTLNRDGWKDMGGTNWNADTAVKNKSRGHAIMINGICGGGNNAQAESVLIDGCTMSGIRGHAIQLYQLRMPVAVENCKINSWGRNAQTAAGTKDDAAIRGDIVSGSNGSLTLTSNYFGLDEKANNILHVNVDNFSYNTNGSRPAGTY